MSTRVWPLGLVLVFSIGCRAKGLPEPPPGQDPADPEAAVPAWRPADNPLEQSAFGEDEPKGQEMHEGHGHHHHGADPEPSPAEEDDAPDSAEPSRPASDEPAEAKPQ